MESNLTRPKYPYTTVGMIFTSIPITIIILIIVFGNLLVIVAVLRDSQLKKHAQNWLIVSLACADLLVGILIMPLTLTYELLDEWILGTFLCELWLSLDVLFVTASILNLCAISLDRYWSLTDPTSYPHARTYRRMLSMIIIVWLSAFAISFPPLVGWRPEERIQNDCVLSDQIGYVLYSAFGSFFLPTMVLLFVYARIYFISRKRKRKPSSISIELKTNKRKISIADRLRLFLSRKSTLKMSNDHISDHYPIENNCLKPISCPDSPPPPQSQPTTDYAAVIARVRALATLRTVTSDCSELEERTKETTICTETSIVSEMDMSSGDGLSHVMAIAAAAAAQSRRETRSESLTAKAYELQKQLRQRRKLIRRRERQATVVLGFVLGSFVFCWMPFFCSYLLSAICCKTPDLIFDIIFWLGYCNSGFNVFIYNFLNRDFRRAFRRILCNPFKQRMTLGMFSSLANTNSNLTKRVKVNETLRSDTPSNKRKGRLLRKQFSSLDNEEID